MISIYNITQSRIHNLLKGYYKEATGAPLEMNSVVLERPKNKELGHFALTIAFSLAKPLKKAPKDIATKLATYLLEADAKLADATAKLDVDKLEDAPLYQKLFDRRYLLGLGVSISEASKASSFTAFSRCESASGFINITLSDACLDMATTIALEEIDVGESVGLGIIAPQALGVEGVRLTSDDPKKPKIQLEFVSANPTGPLHIGHARGAIAGDSLARISGYLGAPMYREYYVNDAGNQIYNLGRSIYIAGHKHFYNEDTPEELCADTYKGDYVYDIAKAYAKDNGKEVFKEPISKADDALIKDIADFGKDFNLDLIKEDMARLGVVFDEFVSEKDMLKKVDAAFEKLKKSGGTYEKDGKLWIKSSKYGDDKDRVIFKEDKSPTYITADIIYHDNKFERGYDYLIDIWGADHHGYIDRVRASINFMGRKGQMLEVILVQMVSLLKDGKPYKMSKRAGNFILLQEVLDEVSPDILRFIFLSKRLDTHLEFDVGVFGNEDINNPVFYINYANSRINTLIEKSGVGRALALESSVAYANDAYKQMCFEALMLPRVLELSLRDRELQKLCEYLKSLAGMLHSNYNSINVLNASEAEKLSMIRILYLTSFSITLGFSMLGIKAKTSM